jgi:diguanylate cyclase (GGDEF)-like protein/PAS domain S-box-containing protein
MAEFPETIQMRTAFTDAGGRVSQFDDAAGHIGPEPALESSASALAGDTPGVLYRMFMRAPLRQLISITAPFMLVVLLMLALSITSMSVLSATRAFVTGEGLRARAERDAMALLRSYARTGSDQSYVMFRQDLAMALGSRTARMALQEDPADFERAAAGLRTAGNHPDDVAGMIRLFRAFQDLPPVAASVAIAAQRDSLVLQLEALATRMHAQGSPGKSDSGAVGAEITALYNQLLPLQSRFAANLDTAARAAQTSLLLMLAVGSALLVAMGSLVCRGLLRRGDAIAAALRATQARAYNEQERADVTLRSIADAVISADRGGCIDYMNAAAERLTGWRFAEARGRRILDVCLLDSIDADTSASGVVAQLGADALATQEGNKTGILRRRDGSSVTIHEHAAPIRDREGRMVGMVLVLRDVTQEHAFTEQLEHQASHDGLTGLVNRAEFERRLRAAADAPRGEREHAVLYFDLDQFKVVNDTCGHSAGDELIRRIGTIVHEQLRSSDTLARLGGDEFGALLQNCGRDAALRVAEGIRHAISDSRFPWQGKTFAVTASIGVLVMDGHLRSVSDIMSAADRACFAAKDGGRNRVQMYCADDRELSARHTEMEWVARIVAAMETGRMTLHAQEIRPLAAPIAGQPGATGGPMLELLLRMLDEQGRQIAPMAFIPAAERYSLMPRVDRWVIRQALHEIVLLNTAGADLPICMINLSAASVQDSGLAAYIGEEIATHGVAPDKIGFEFTETAVITHLSKATNLMRKLKALGCQVALDDFGSGMSAFAYLRSLPVDFLKIDGNFISDMVKDPVVYAMVEAIQRVGSVIGIRTVAEWVEDEATLAALTVVGMDYVQGYAVGRPEPLAHVARALGERRRQPTRSALAGTVSDQIPELRRAGGLRLIS